MSDDSPHRELLTMGVLGRVGIPYKVRKELDINDGDTLEITIKDGCIVLRRVALVKHRATPVK